MALVVFNGVQYDDRRLPAYVDPKVCVPLDEWLTANRRVRTRPLMPATNPAGAARPAPVEPTAKPGDIANAAAKRPRKG